MTAITTLGRFTIEGQFSSEGPGRMYRGLTETGRPVLLSVVPADLAHGAATVADDGLKLMDMGTLDTGEIYLAYDIPSGETLAQRLGRGALGWAEAARAFLPALDTLARSHAEGRAYGEIAPSKTVIRTDGAIALVGREVAALSRAFDRRKDDKVSPTLDQAPYLSPERARGEPASPASDLFEIAVVIFESIAGRRAFDAPSVLAVLHRVQAGEVPELRSYDPSVPAVLSDAVALALSKDPTRRPSLATLKAALAVAVESRPSETKPAVAMATPSPEPDPRSPPVLPALEAVAAPAGVEPPSAALEPGADAVRTDEVAPDETDASSDVAARCGVAATPAKKPDGFHTDDWFLTASGPAAPVAAAEAVPVESPLRRFRITRMAAIVASFLALDVVVAVGFLIAGRSDSAAVEDAARSTAAGPRSAEEPQDESGVEAASDFDAVASKRLSVETDPADEASNAATGSRGEPRSDESGRAKIPFVPLKVEKPAPVPKPAPARRSTSSVVTASRSAADRSAVKRTRSSVRTETARKGEASRRSSRSDWTPAPRGEPRSTPAEPRSAARHGESLKDPF